jgi:hypothetical protein
MAERVPSLDGWHSLEWWAKAEKRSKKTIRRWTYMGLRHSKIGASIQIHDDDMARFKAAHLRGGNLDKAA